MDTLDMAWTGVRLSAEDRTIYPDGIWHLPWVPAIVEIAPHSDIGACRVRVGQQSPYIIAVGSPLVWPFGEAGADWRGIPLEVRPHGRYVRAPGGALAIVDKLPVLPRFDSFTAQDTQWPRLALRAYRNPPGVTMVRRADGEYITSRPAFVNAGLTVVAAHPVYHRHGFAVTIVNEVGGNPLTYQISLRTFHGLTGDAGAVDRWSDTVLVSGMPALAAGSSVGYEFSEHGDVVIVEFLAAIATNASVKTRTWDR